MYYTYTANKSIYLIKLWELYYVSLNWASSSISCIQICSWIPTT